MFNQKIFIFREPPARTNPRPGWWRREGERRCPMHCMKRRHALPALILAATAALNCGSAPAPPAVHVALPYQTAEIQLPGCGIRFPPVRDRRGDIAEQIRRSGDADRICALAAAMKRALEDGSLPEYGPEGWARIESIEIEWRPPLDPPTAADRPAPTLTIEAKIPGFIYGVVAQLHRPREWTTVYRTLQR